jgi:putative spermidine/putrescine transport system permease protein
MSIAASPASLERAGPAAEQTARARSFLLAVPATLLVATIIGLPLVLLFRYSLNQYDRYDMMREALTLDNYAAIFRDAFFRNVLLRTILVAAISTAAALALALPVAYFIARAPARFKSALIILVVFPLLVGNLVRAAGWMAVMGNRGFVNQLLLGLGLIAEPLEILYTPTAVVIGIIAVVLPFMTLSLQSVLEQIDPSLEEAAGNLGARPFTAFRRVVLPLAMPGVIAGTVLVFILCMNAYATPVLLGGPRFHMMAPQVYEQITGQSNWPFGGALAFILMGTTLVLTVASTQLMQKSYARRAL